MQALNIGPLKGGLLAGPQLDVEVGFNCCSSVSIRKGRNRRCLVDNAFFVKNSSSPMVSCNSGYFPGRACSKSCSFGVLSSKPEYVALSGPKKGHFGSLFALARASEERADGNEFQRVELSSNGSLSRTGERDADCQHFARSEDSDGSGEEKGTEKLDYVNEGEVWKEEFAMVNDALVQSLCGAKTVDDVQEVLKDKGELSLRVYSHLISTLGWEKKMEPALALVGWLKRKKNETDGAVGLDVFIYNSLLTAAKRCRKFREAERILNEMTQEGFLADVVTYNIMMSIYIEGGRATDALDIFDEIQKKGFAPTGTSYRAALLALRKLDDADGALKLFTKIKEKHQKGELGKYSFVNWDIELIRIEKSTSSICYQSMLRWLGIHENRGIQVVKLLICMDKAGLYPHRVGCERLLRACKNEKDYIVAKELYARIREKYSEISKSACDHVIWIMGKAGKWEAALEIYEDMLVKGPKPYNLSYKLINVCYASKVELRKWVFRLLNQIEERGLKPESKDWNMVLIACSKASETSVAVKIFKRMVEQGMEPTVFSYGLLLSALKKDERYDEAVNVWNHMLKVGVQASSHCYNIMVGVFAGLGKFSMIDNMIQVITSAGIEPTVGTYNAIITAYAGNGMSSTANEWFNRMKLQNISPNEFTYNMLIEGLAKEGKSEAAFRLYLMARNEHRSVCSRAYDAVVDSLLEHRAAIELTELGPPPKVVVRKTLTTNGDQ